MADTSTPPARRLLTDPRVRWAGVAALATAILVGSVLPEGGSSGVLDGTGPLGAIGADKWAHAGAYAGLAAAVAVALDRRPDPRLLVGVVLAVAGYGLAMDLLQTAVPRRSFDPADLAANAAGATVAVAGWWVLATLGLDRWRSGDGEGSANAPDPDPDGG